GRPLRQNPPRTGNSTGAELPRRPCPRELRARPLLLLLLERDPGSLRGFVVFGFGLGVLARDVQGIGLRRQRPRVGGAGVEAISNGSIDLSLQHRALTGERGSCGQGNQDEGGGEALHLSPPLGLVGQERSPGIIVANAHDVKTRSARAPESESPLAPG